jgi:hypothetical protein
LGIRFALLVLLYYRALGRLGVRRLLRTAPPTKTRAAPRAVEGEMVRDPICGTWVDRRLAVVGRRGGESVAVCSDDCRRRLEAG